MTLRSRTVRAARRALTLGVAFVPTLLAIATIILYARSWTQLKRLFRLRGYGYNFTGLASAGGRISFESIRDRPSRERRTVDAFRIEPTTTP